MTGMVFVDPRAGSLPARFVRCRAAGGWPPRPIPGSDSARTWPSRRALPRWPSTRPRSPMSWSRSPRPKLRAAERTGRTAGTAAPCRGPRRGARPNGTPRVGRPCAHPGGAGAIPLRRTRRRRALRDPAWLAGPRSRPHRRRSPVVRARARGLSGRSAQRDGGHRARALPGPTMAGLSMRKRRCGRRCWRPERSAIAPCWRRPRPRWAGASIGRGDRTKRPGVLRGAGDSCGSPADAARVALTMARVHLSEGAIPPAVRAARHARRSRGRLGRIRARWRRPRVCSLPRSRPPGTRDLLSGTSARACAPRRRRIFRSRPCGCASRGRTFRSRRARRSRLSARPRRLVAIAARLPRLLRFQARAVRARASGSGLDARDAGVRQGHWRVRASTSARRGGQQSRCRSRNVSRSGSHRQRRPHGARTDLRRAARPAARRLDSHRDGAPTAACSRLRAGRGTAIRMWPGARSAAALSVAADPSVEPCQAAEPLRYGGETDRRRWRRAGPREACSTRAARPPCSASARLPLAANVRALLDRAVPDSAAAAAGEDLLGDSAARAHASRSHRARRACAVPRAHRRGERHRQGARGARDSPARPAARSPVLRAQLRGAVRRPDRGRAVRPRARRVHRRGGRAPRPLRGGGRRHAVPRRDRRAVGAGPGQAAARAPGRRGPPRRRERLAPRRRADRRGHQPAARAGSGGRPVPRRPALPARRGPHRRARRSATAPATCRCSRRASGAMPPRAWARARRCRPRPSRRSRATTGRATCASCRTCIAWMAVHSPRRGRVGAAALARRTLAQRDGRRRPARSKPRGRSSSGGSSRPRWPAPTASAPGPPKRSASRDRGWPR